MHLCIPGHHSAIEIGFVVIIIIIIKKERMKQIVSIRY